MPGQSAWGAGADKVAVAACHLDRGSGPNAAWLFVAVAVANAIHQQPWLKDIKTAPQLLGDLWT